jgi:hypothetical protein
MLIRMEHNRNLKQRPMMERLKKASINWRIGWYRGKRHLRRLMILTIPRHMN